VLVAFSEQQLIGKLHTAQAKSLLKRGLRVQAKARKLLGGDVNHIKRVDTGNLRSSIGVQLREYNGVPVVRIGTNVKYATYVRYGTGIYGPYRRPIVPKRAKVMVFKAKGGAGRKSGTVFTRRVVGIKANDFLGDALNAARG